MKKILLTISLAMLASGTHAAWQRLGGQESRPVDTASSSIPGTRVATSAGLGQPENLLSDDVTAKTKAGPGKSEVVINLSRQVISSFTTFFNEGAEGSATLSASPDQIAWTELEKEVFTGADSAVNFKYASVQAKYLRLQFDLSKGGNFRQLAVYGVDTDRDYKVLDATPSSPSISMNAAGGMGGSRIVYIHPSPIEGDEVAARYGRFEFPESGEKFRTVIYDLGRERTLTEVGSVHSPRPVRLQAYAFERELPEKEDWRGRRSFDPAIFDTLEPIATIEDAQGLGYVKAKLPKSIKARYVALRWEPDFNPPGFGVSGISITMSNVQPPSFAPGNGDSNSGGSGSGGSGSGQGAAEGATSGFIGGSSFSPFSFSSGGFGSSGSLPRSTPNSNSQPNPLPGNVSRPVSGGQGTGNASP